MLRGTRPKYQGFVAEGVTQGKRPELTGGGLMRSLIGAGQTGMNPVDGGFQLGDERILGDGDFVAEILAQGEAKLTAKESYRAAGFGLDELARVVADVLKIDPAEVLASGKQPQRVQARSLYCYWAVRELGFSATALGRQLGISQPAASIAVQRGERMAREHVWNLALLGNL